MRDVLIYFIHLCWGIFRISMFLSCFPTTEGLFDVSADVCALHQRHRRTNSPDTNPCQLQYLAGLRGEDVYPRLSNSLMNLYRCLPVYTMISGHGCVSFQLLWHGCAWQFLTCVVSYVDTETERRMQDWLVHTGSLWSSRNPCWRLWSRHHVSPKAAEHILYMCLSVCRYSLDLMGSHKIRLLELPNIIILSYIDSFKYFVFSDVITLNELIMCARSY